MFYGEGTTRSRPATEFVGIAIRTQVDAANPEDVNYVNSLQDQIAVKLPEGQTPKEFKARDWDIKSLDALRAKYQEEAKALPNLNATSGARGTIDPHHAKAGSGRGTRPLAAATCGVYLPRFRFERRPVL